jgi:hypothetical protein
MARRFTLGEARQLLPLVGRLLREAVALKAEYQEAERQIQALSGQITLMGGMVVDRTRVLAARSQRDESASRLKSALEQVQGVGCVIKDLDIGLVDFPTLFKGREVYLCWKLGEEDITYWHGVEEGFAGRKPIDREFIENHEGEHAQ